jgi:hypothetical protein
MQLQCELCESLAKIRQEPLRVAAILESRDEVIRLCRMPGYAALT